LIAAEQIPPNGFVLLRRVDNTDLPRQIFFGKSDQKTETIQTGLWSAAPIVAAPRDTETQEI
jgi:hypothetical protein